MPEDESKKIIAISKEISTSTTAVGINDAGQVSGSYEDANATTHGFPVFGWVFSTVDVFGRGGDSLDSYPKPGLFCRKLHRSIG